MRGIDYSKLSVDDLKAEADDGNVKAQVELKRRSNIEANNTQTAQNNVANNSTAQENKTAEKQKEIDYSKLSVDDLRKLAEQGGAKAQLFLGLRYGAGEGVAKDRAEQGLAAAQNNLGIAYFNGTGVAGDQAEAVKWFRKAAEQGEENAKNVLAELEEAETENKTAEKQKEIDYSKLSPDELRKLADKGDAKAQCNLGVAYYQGKGVAKDYAEAVKWFRKAAEQGDAQAQYNLGVMYGKGEGVAKDYAEAVKWFRKAAEQGEENAKNVLAELGEAETENKTAEKQKEIDYSKLSPDELRKLAEQGDAVAQGALGLAYSQLFTEDFNLERGAEAGKWLGKAAKQGLAGAKEQLDVLAELCGTLGLNYLTGDEETTIDPKKGTRYLRQAAELGHKGSQFNLAINYQNGVGVTKDMAEAVKWYRKAAEQGHAGAQFNLGVMYANGEGVAKDQAEAVKWYKKAAAQGQAEAKHNLDILLNPKPQQTGGYSGGYSGGGNFEIDKAAAEKAKHDAEFREKVENVQRQIKEIDRNIASHRKDHQNHAGAWRYADAKNDSPLIKDKRYYEYMMKQAEEKIRELEKKKRRLLDTLK
ncbi:hypothetical protein FACS189443_4690 [Planctomycetales bacterium]|nr:hypothetical protein FACS189443_4690 [Planctomycetales bacterium]